MKNDRLVGSNRALIRPLVAGPLITTAYLLITLVALTRVLAALNLGEMQAMLALTGAAWLAGWSLFSWRYWPILTAPRLEKDRSL